MFLFFYFFFFLYSWIPDIVCWFAGLTLLQKVQNNNSVQTSSLLQLRVSHLGFGLPDSPLEQETHTRLDRCSCFYRHRFSFSPSHFLPPFPAPSTVILFTLCTVWGNYSGDSGELAARNAKRTEVICRCDSFTFWAPGWPPCLFSWILGICLNPR